MKKDILFLCQFFYPEYNSSATLPFDTAKSMADKGFSVGALCGYPKEYSNSGKVPLREEQDGVAIRRLRYLQAGRVSKLGRLVNYFSFTVSAFLHLFTVKNYRCVTVYSNPPVLPLVALAAHRLFGTKIIFVAYDIYPEVAYASASLEQGSLIDRAMKRINRQLYKKASAVVALTQEMKQFILENREGIAEEAIHVIPNWAHEKAHNKTADDYVRFGCREGQLTVGYIGNMGICQDVEALLTAVKALQNDERVRFLVIGHGSKMPYVKAQTEGLDNVRIIDYLTGEEFESAMSLLDCGIVSLESGLKGTCAPSKYYSYLQSGCAVLSVTEADSYIAREVTEEKIGFAVPLGKGDTLTAAVRELASQPERCAAMGERAKALYRSRYATDIAMNRYQTLFNKLLT